MLAANHLPNSASSSEPPEKKQYRVLRFDPRSEPGKEDSSVEVQHLENEVRALRDALQEAQRQLAHYDVLLRNAQLRERELRAELLKGR